MKTLKTLPVAAAIAMALGGATITPAAAATYAGTRQVSANGFVKLLLVTDDTVGVLTEDNVLDWTVFVTNGIDSQTLFGPLSGDNSVLRLKGNALSASATQLLFDFEGAGILMFGTEFSPAVRGYCMDGEVHIQFRCGQDNIPGSERIFFGTSSPDNVNVFTDGLVVLGAAVGGPAPDPTPASVPEPTAWALMIMGFGLAGAQLRRRRVTAA